MQQTFRVDDPVLYNYVLDQPWHNSTQVHIPKKKSSRGFVTKMKCQVNSNSTHDILISKEIGYKSYKNICIREPKKVNLGFNNDPWFWKVENNMLMPFPELCVDQNNCVHGKQGMLTHGWEVLAEFLSIHKNLEQNWLDCNNTWGWYDEDLGGWTGCMGKV